MNKSLTIGENDDVFIEDNWCQLKDIKNGEFFRIDTYRIFKKIIINWPSNKTETRYLTNDYITTIYNLNDETMVERLPVAD